jgi:hypothetical protein
MQIKFDDDFPEGMRQDIVRTTEPLMNYLPRWVNELCFGWEHLESGVLAESHCSEQYRRHKVCVGMAFFSESEERRRHCVLHEILHCYTTPIRLVAQEVINEKCEGSTHTLVTGSLTRAMERCTEDLTNMVESCWGLGL